jgi:hypothetical protein
MVCKAALLVCCVAAAACGRIGFQVLGVVAGDGTSHDAPVPADGQVSTYNFDAALGRFKFRSKPRR